MSESSPQDNSNSIVPDNPVASAWQRYNKLKTVDDDKNRLIEELIIRYEWVSEAHNKISVEQLRNEDFYRSYHQVKKELEAENTHLKELLTRDPFVLVLIDGDGMIFHEHLLNDAEAGGKKAATLLHDSTITYVHECLEGLPKNIRILCRMYANLRGLANTCHKTGIVPSIAHLEEFSRGFTHGNIHFDFIDVGPEKDQAGEKIAEALKAHVNDTRCMQIFVGCSHDSAYARLLGIYMYNKEARIKITLLEGVPFEKELTALIDTCHFQHVKFGNLFRETKFNLQRNAVSGWVALNEIALRGVHSDRDLTGTPSESVSSSKTPSLVAGTWASKAAAAAIVPGTPPISKTTPASPLTRQGPIPQNRKGQRVDAEIPKYDKFEVDRIKRLKMCNVHFLRQECPYGDTCTHRHDYKPTKTDLEWLRVVARMAACHFGSGCEDAKCIYGHRCQAPERMDKSKLINDGGKSCIFGSECVFPPELHNMDTVVIKTIRV